MSTNRQPDSKPTVRENDIFRGAHKYRLDQPLAVQIWRYVVSIVTRFDFGPSFHYKDQSVNEIIRQGFPVTLTYGAWSFAVAVLVGITLGVAAAVFTTPCSITWPWASRSAHRFCRTSSWLLF